MTKLRSVRRLLVGVASGLTFCGLSVMMSATSSSAAEKVTFRYGAFYRSIAVADLVEYANTGKATPDLNSFLGLVKAKDRQQLVSTLKIKLPFNVAAVDRLLQTPTADGLLKEVSSATILPGGSEFLAMRSAILVAASTKEGLTTTNLLRSYPTPTLTVDLKRLSKLMKGQTFQSLGGMMGEFMKSKP